MPREGTVHDPPSQALKLLIRAAQLIGAAGLVLLLLVSGYAAVERYVFHTTGAWVAEIEEYLLLLTVFIVSGSAYAEGDHVSADMVVRMLPRAGRRIAGVLVDAVGIAFCAFMFYVGALKASQLYAARIHSASSLQTPLYLIALLLPLSMLLLGIAFADRLVRSVRQGSTEASV